MPNTIQLPPSIPYRSLNRNLLTTVYDSVEDAELYTLEEKNRIRIQRASHICEKQPVNPIYPKS